jgi:outer membrane protein assembly factor BamA
MSRSGARETLRSVRCVRLSAAILVGLLWLFGSAAMVLAEDPAPAASPQSPAPGGIPAPPDFARNKPPLPDLTLKDKKPGSYFTGIPILGTDPDSGVAFGAQIQWYDDGSKDDPLFYYAPYRKRVSATASVTTKGTQQYYLEYDQPYVADSPWRIRGYGGYLRYKYEDYFGIGTSTLGKLSFPGTPGVTYSNVDDYFNALRDNRAGETWAYYNYYDKQQILFTADVERDFLGGLLRPLLGIQVSYINARDYTGTVYNGSTNQETKLLADYQTGLIRGFGGGWANLVRAGLTYDTRDYEPDPTRGILGQVLVEGAMRWLGASANYGHVNVTGQGYYRLFPELTRLVLAANLVYSNHFGTVPFYAYPSMAAPGNYTKEGLGGWQTLRGFLANRFVGPIQIQGNLELRWTFADFTIWNQNLRPMLAPFVDAGRVFNKTGQFTLNDLQVTGGLALRVAWNLATLISFDLGFSREGYGFYMQIGHPF